MCAVSELSDNITKSNGRKVYNGISNRNDPKWYVCPLEESLFLPNKTDDTFSTNERLGPWVSSKIETLVQ